MLTLKTTTVEDGCVFKSVYEAAHSNPGKYATTLKLDVQVEVNLRFNEVKATVLVNPRLTGATTEEALDKLADWAERLAIAIRHRGVATNLVPVFADPVRPEPLPDSDADDA